MTISPSMHSSIQKILNNLGKQNLQFIGNYSFIYIYENPNISNQIYIPHQIALVLDGLEKFTSLNALDSFSPRMSSLIFFNQQISREFSQYNFSSIIIEEGHMNLVIPQVLAHLESSEIIGPFENTFNHDPSYIWSKASTSHQEWHLYLEKFDKYASKQISIFYRFSIFLKNKRFYSKPSLAVGVVILKFLEYFSVGLGFLASTIRE